MYLYTKWRGRWLKCVSQNLVTAFDKLMLIKFEMIAMHQGAAFFARISASLSILTYTASAILCLLKWSAPLVAAGAVLQPLSSRQALGGRCEGNGAVRQPLPCLTWLCVAGTAIFYSCWFPVCLLLVSVYLWITPCPLVCMLLSSCSLVFLLNKHLSRRYSVVQLWKRRLFP